MIILFGAGAYGRDALNYFGIRNVYCFVDSFKAGTLFCQKHVISFEELLKIHNDHTIIISTKNYSKEISSKLIEAGIKFENYMDHWNKYMVRCSLYPKLKNLKNIHKGNKIFLIGNGSSLRADDLKRVQSNGYKTLACNFINLLFDKTDWRPDFYCCVENSAILSNREFILNYPLELKFIKHILKPELTDMFKEFIENEDLHVMQVGGMDKFSEDISSIVYDGGTVMYPMLQLAVYMGFSEIYLLGVDNTQPPSVHTKNFVDARAHFYDESTDVLEKRKQVMERLYISGEDSTDDYKAYQERVNAHYKIAKAYCDKHGIKIFNATRGGELEVFERVDFEKLF